MSSCHIMYNAIWTFGIYYIWYYFTSVLQVIAAIKTEVGKSLFQRTFALKDIFNNYFYIYSHRNRFWKIHWKSFCQNLKSSTRFKGVLKSKTVKSRALTSREFHARVVGGHYSIRNRVFFFISKNANVRLPNINKLFIK